MTLPIINQEYLINTLSSLVGINSINPVLSTEAIGEEEIARYIAETMQAMRLEVHLHEIAPKRYNVVGIKRGKGSGKCLMLNAHMDTVGIEGMESAINPTNPGWKIVRQRQPGYERWSRSNSGSCEIVAR